MDRNRRVDQQRSGKPVQGKPSRSQHLKNAGKDLLNQTVNGVELAGGLADLANPLNRNKGQALVNTGKAAINGIVNGGKAVVNGFKALFNHPEWYTRFPISNMVNLDYARRKGVLEFTALLEDSNIALHGRMPHSVPLCGKLNADLVIPVTTEVNNPVWWQSISLLYTNIMRGQTGATTFKAEDVEAYVLSVRNLQAVYAELRRLYAVLLNVNAADASVPYSYLVAMGFETYDSYIARAGDIRNTGVIVGRQVAVATPLGLPIIDRTRWMFSNGFADSDDMKHSPWFFNLSSFPTWKRDEQGSYTYSQKNWLAVKQSENVDEYLTAITSMLTEFSTDSVMQKVASAVSRIYGARAYYGADEWPIDMAMPIVYDEMALTQIQNATVINSTNDVTVTYTTSTTTKLHNAKVAYSISSVAGSAYSTYEHKAFVNMYKDQISAGETLSATRLVCTFAIDDGAGTASSTVNIMESGTEIIGRGGVVVYTGTGTLVVSALYRTLNLGLFTQVAQYSTAPGVGVTAHNIISGSIDWAPMTVPSVLQVTGTSPAFSYTAELLYPIWDFNNFAVIEGDKALQNLHQIAIYSMLAPLDAPAELSSSRVR